MYTALKEFGAPLENLAPDDFARKGYFYQMGMPPLRIDIMMSTPGIAFDGAWGNRESVELGEQKIHFISRSDLIHAKEAGGRPQDRVAADKLKEAELLDKR